MKNQEVTHFCLAEDCKEDLLVDPESPNHKHSKTDIHKISQIREKLSQAWEPKHSQIEPYFEQVATFYESLRKEINKLIDEDQKVVQRMLTKVKYHHLPYEANTQAYLDFLQKDYHKLNKTAMIGLLNEAESGQLNKQLNKQKEITDFLDLELKKVQDKVLTLKYIMPSKKIETQLLSPNLSQPSEVANHQDFIKIYSFFNGRGLLIRLAKLIYRGSEHDNSPKAFYNRCNGIGNCMAIIKTKKNKLVGGFSPLPLVYHDEEEIGEGGKWADDKSRTSFIFSISALKSFSLKDSERALRYNPGKAGPSFGKDLEIDTVATSSLGHSYQCDFKVGVDSMEARIVLLEEAKAEIKEFEIWQLSF